MRNSALHRPKNKRKIGIIRIPSKPPFPQNHELETAGFLAGLGYDVDFILPSQMKGIRTPDIKMQNLKWEIKSPISDGNRSIEHAMRTALRQSENIIFDLRRSKISTERALSKIKSQIDKKKIKRFLVITKSHKLLDLKNNFVIM